MTGEEFEGRWLTEIDTGYEEHWFEVFGRVASTGEGERHELYAEPDGIWYNFYVFKPEGAGSRRVAVVFEDITERKKMEQLRETNERLEQELRTEHKQLDVAVENSPLVLFRLDTDLRYTWVRNPAQDFEDVDILGKREDELLPPEAAETLMAPKRQALETGERLREEVTYELPSGHVTYDLTVSPLRDESGEITGLVCAALDITERKNAERKLQQQAELDSFRVDLTDAIRSLSDPSEIQREAARVLGERLDADRAHYIVVGDDEDTFWIGPDYYRGDALSDTGERRLADYGEYIVETLRAGENLVLDDTQSAPELSDEDRAAHASVDTHASVAVPLIKDGRLVAFFAVDNAEAREWTDEEIEMVEETAERTWAAVERAQAERQRRESNEKLELALDAVQMGTWKWDLEAETVDGDGRFLEMFDLSKSDGPLPFEEFLARLGHESVEEAEAVMNTEFEPGEYIEGEVRIDDVPDAPVWINWRARAIEDDPPVLFGVSFDITERKHTQQSLERLTDASHELIDADVEAIQDCVDEFAVDVLGVEYAALWRYDEASGDLTEATSTLNAEIDTDALRHPDDVSEHVWQTFVSEDIDIAADLPVDETVPDGATLRSRLLIPLGRHGVVYAGSLASDVFDERVVELAQSFGATVESAWDRADSEQRLQAQNEELTRLDDLNSLIRRIDQALVSAVTREEIDEAVCEQLASSDLYESAWLATYTVDSDSVRPQAWAGIDSGYLEDRTATLWDESSDDPLVTAHRTGEMQIVADIATDPRASVWREHALEHGARSAVTIPLVYGESKYGIITVWGRTPQPDERETEVLAEFGGTIAHAIHALEATTTRRTDSVVELTLRTTTAETPLVRLARELDCVIEFEGLVQGADGDAAVFFTARNVSAAEMVAAGEQLLAIAELNHVADRETGALFKARLDETTLAGQILERGAMIRSLRIEAGTAMAVVELPETGDVRAFVEGLEGDVRDLELLARRTRTRETEGTLQSTVLDRLTPRQQEVLQLAYRSGYFEMPRIRTGQELADTLGIVPSTFAKHIRSAERNALDVIFANEREEIEAK
ncbi:bacterio-opsin activator domain-containing protein [Haloarchaeobius litoreus]|uniref:Bacterio-opsin activator domain-containing protein n=1 Tax=Haloarchaeobius litoreus TaxID=755306 RepID=A0ABD6DPE1_9EURY